MTPSGSAFKFRSLRELDAALIVLEAQYSALLARVDGALEGAFQRFESLEDRLNLHVQEQGTVHGGTVDGPVATALLALDQKIAVLERHFNSYQESVASSLQSRDTWANELEERFLALKGQLTQVEERLNLHVQEQGTVHGGTVDGPVAEAIRKLGEHVAKLWQKVEALASNVRTAAEDHAELREQVAALERADLTPQHEDCKRTAVSVQLESLPLRSWVGEQVRRLWPRRAAGSLEAEIDEWCGFIRSLADRLDGGDGTAERSGASDGDRLLEARQERDAAIARAEKAEAERDDLIRKQDALKRLWLSDAPAGDGGKEGE